MNTIDKNKFIKTLFRSYYPNINLKLYEFGYLYKVLNESDHHHLQTIIGFYKKKKHFIKLLTIYLYLNRNYFKIIISKKDTYIEPNSLFYTLDNSNQFIDIIYHSKNQQKNIIRHLIDKNFVPNELINENNEHSLDISSMTEDIIDLDFIKNCIWNKYCPNDKNKGTCFCCRKEIRRNEMEVEFGHVIPKSKGGEYIIDNIRPICIKCNRGREGIHCMHMYEYMIKNKMEGLKYIEAIELKEYILNNCELIEFSKKDINNNDICELPKSNKQAQKNVIKKSDDLIIIENIMDKYYDKCKVKMYDNCISLKLLYNEIYNNIEDENKIKSIIRYTENKGFTRNLKNFLKKNNSKYEIQKDKDGNVIMGSKKFREQIMFLRG